MIFTQVHLSFISSSFKLYWNVRLFCVYDHLEVLCDPLLFTSLVMILFFSLAVNDRIEFLF